MSPSHKPAVSLHQAPAHSYSSVQLAGQPVSCLASCCFCSPLDDATRQSITKYIASTLHLSSLAIRVSFCAPPIAVATCTLTFVTGPSAPQTINCRDKFTLTYRCLPIDDDRDTATQRWVMSAIIQFDCLKGKLVLRQRSGVFSFCPLIAESCVCFSIPKGGVLVKQNNNSSNITLPSINHNTLRTGRSTQSTGVTVIHCLNLKWGKKRIHPEGMQSRKREEKVNKVALFVEWKIKVSRFSFLFLPPPQPQTVSI